MSDAKKIRDYQKSRQPKPPISALEHRANCEDIVNNLLMPIVDKLRNSPSDIRSLGETYEELIAQMNGVPRQPYIMQAGKRRLAVCDDIVTEFEYQPTIIDSGASEKPVIDTDSLLKNNDVDGLKNVTSNILSDLDLELLRKIENAK